MLKKILRFFVYPILYKFGIPGLLIGISKRNLILCYHGVTKNPNFQINNRHIFLSQFEKDIQFYSKHFEIVSLSDFFIKRVKQNAKPLLAITFDDGYLNNFINVLPLIAKYNVPVTFFIISGSLDNENFITWYDLIDFVKLSKPTQIEFNNSFFLRSQNNTYHNNNEELDQRVKSLGVNRQKALDDFYIRYKTDIDQHKKEFPEYWRLASREVVALNASNPLLIIGSHTHLHFNLANIGSNLAENELIMSKKILEEICLYEIKSIAYPDGSYNDNVKSLSQKAGYTELLAVDYRMESDLDDKKILRRYSVSNSTTHEANMLKLALGIKNFGIKF